MGSVVLMCLVAIAVTASWRFSRRVFAGKLGRSLRGLVGPSGVTMVLALGGCAGTSSHSQTALQRKVVIGSQLAGGEETMLKGRTDQQKIQSMQEVNAARLRALPIETEIQREIVRLHGEVMRLPGLSEHERADKEQEIDRLRKQWKRLREPVAAFYKRLDRRAEQVERAVANKDPVIKRLHEEATRISERKGKNEVKEIERVKEEFDRRLAELESGSQ
jgi:hypothetical protein